MLLKPLIELKGRGGGGGQKQHSVNGGGGMVRGE